MLVITRLFRSVIELNESTRFAAFSEFSGHVNIMSIRIYDVKNSPLLRKKVYHREFRLQKEAWVDVATVAEVQEIINLFDYLIIREQDVGYDQNYDDCVWDGDRIEATKTILFHEYLARGGHNA